MKRLLLATLVLPVLLVVGPPLLYLLVPVPTYVLPGADRTVPIRNGVELSLVDRGTGPAVVLVHGLPGSAHDWRATTEQLAGAGYRVIAYDRAGYGRSTSRLAGADTLQDNVRNLADLLTALGLDDVVLVGWSYGGAAVMQLAADEDPRIRGLVLVGTGGPDSDDATPPEASTGMRLFYSTPALHWRRLVPPVGRGLMSVLSEQAFSGKPQPAWWMESLIANFSRWETVLVYRAEMFAPIDATFTPEKISVPVRILHGDDDRLAPVSIGRYLAEKIPGATYHEVAGGSHMLPVIHPGLVVGEVTALLRGN